MSAVSGRLILERKGQWLNRLKGYRVFIDGNEVGRINNASAEEYEVPGGNHVMRCGVNWCSSNEYAFDIKPGETIYLRVGTGMKYFWILYGFFFAAVLTKFLDKTGLGSKMQWGAMAVAGICLLYFLYYLTLGRKRYLKVEEDTSSVFTSRLQANSQSFVDKTH